MSALRVVLLGRGAGRLCRFPVRVRSFEPELNVRIYLVEDGSLVRGRLCRMISQVPCVEVIGWTGDAEKALCQIAGLNPDVVVLDLDLKEGNGFQVLSPLATLPVRPVIIVLTDHPYRPFRDAAHKFGAHYFFDKSIEFGEMLKVIDCLAPQESRAPT